MDTFTTMVGMCALFFIFAGEQFKKGVYIWLSILFVIIFALRMGEPMFYMVTAGVVSVLVFRVFDAIGSDVRDNEDRS